MIHALSFSFCFDTVIASSCFFRLIASFLFAFDDPALSWLVVVRAKAILVVKKRNEKLHMNIPKTQYMIGIKATQTDGRKLNECN
jgi:hypothetical protein